MWRPEWEAFAASACQLIAHAAASASKASPLWNSTSCLRRKRHRLASSMSQLSESRGTSSPVPKSMSMRGSPRESVASWVCSVDRSMMLRLGGSPWVTNAMLFLTLSLGVGPRVGAGTALGAGAGVAVGVGVAGPGALPGTGVGEGPGVGPMAEATVSVEIGRTAGIEVGSRVAGEVGVGGGLTAVLSVGVGEGGSVVIPGCVGWTVGVAVGVSVGVGPASPRHDTAASRATNTIRTPNIPCSPLAARTLQAPW